MSISRKDFFIRIVEKRINTTAFGLFWVAGFMNFHTVPLRIGCANAKNKVQRPSISQSWALKSEFTDEFWGEKQQWIYQFL